jgi:phage/plasmid-like protein (TIGR03299 family)
MNQNNQTEQLLGQAFAGMKLIDESKSEAVADLLDRYGLRWQVSKQKLHLPDGTPTQFFGVVREDNQKVFMSSKESYTPYQNSELAELLITMSEKTGYEIKGGGMFNDGAKVYLQLDTGNSINSIGINNDRVNGYVTGINSHDGSTALRWGLTNITISCKNTFTMAAKQLQNSAKHTNAIYNRVDKYLRELGYIVEQEKNLFDQFIRLSEIPVTQKLIAQVVRDITGVDTLDVNYKEAEYSTYQINRTEELLTSIASEMQQKGETKWGLFSGVTHYTSHVMPVAKRDNARTESKYIGTGARFDNSALITIMN